MFMLREEAAEIFRRGVLLRDMIAGILMGMLKQSADKNPLNSGFSCRGPAGLRVDVAFRFRADQLVAPSVAILIMFVGRFFRPCFAAHQVTLGHRITLGGMDVALGLGAYRLRLRLHELLFIATFIVDMLFHAAHCGPFFRQDGSDQNIRDAEHRDTAQHTGQSGQIAFQFPSGQQA